MPGICAIRRLKLFLMVMIRGFHSAQPLEPEERGHVQWVPALAAGFIAGAILLIVPRGSPWSSVTFFNPVIMGRGLAPGFQMPLLAVWLVHLAIAILYGLVISRIIASLTQSRGILVGGLIGLLLYLLNLLMVALVWPQLRGGEASVIFTHVVFGLLAAGAYRGLLRRKVASQVPVP